MTPTTLRLTLKRQPFEVMQTFEKLAEFRKPSAWLMSRILNKDGLERDYDLIEFSNGYGANVPKFTAVYCGFEICETPRIEKYSNGLEVQVEEGDIMLCFLQKQDYDDCIAILEQANNNLKNK